MISSKWEALKRKSNNEKGHWVVLIQWHCHIQCRSVPNSRRLTMQRLLITGNKLASWVWPLVKSISQFALCTVLLLRHLPSFHVLSAFNCTATVLFQCHFHPYFHLSSNYDYFLLILHHSQFSFFCLLLPLLKTCLFIIIPTTIKRKPRSEERDRWSKKMNEKLGPHRVNEMNEVKEEWR